MSYDEMDLDAIMAEFDTLDSETPKPPAEEAPIEPAAPEAYEEPLPDEETGEEGFDEEYEEEYEEKPRGFFGRRKKKKTEPEAEDFAEEEPFDPEPEEEKAEPKAKEYRPLPVGLRLLLDVVLLALLLAGLWWSLNNLHPMGVTAMPHTTPAPVVTAAPTPEVTDAPVLVVTPTETEAPVVTPEPTPEPIRYYIPEDALVAPAPDPAAFGSVPVDEAYRILDVIQQARDSGLLREDEEVAFDPNANFYTGLYAEEIKYYLDDSILTIVWKEDMDGRCCSFAEIKVRDGSQFRRKFADDSFGSYNYYFASELARSTNCVIAMNADYYAFRDFGIVAYNRELYRFNTSTYTGSYKKYNCFDTLFVTADGDFLYKELGEVNTEESIRQFMAENDVVFSLAFGPILVRDGVATVTSWYPAGEVDTAYSRAGIGLKDKLHYLFMTVNHGSNAANCTVNKMAEFFARKGVITAYGLDGGQTSEIVWQGVPYNHVDWASERLVSDIIYFASAVGSTGEGGGV